MRIASPSMGNTYCPSALRSAIASGDVTRVEELLDRAGPEAGRLVNDDFAQDCVLEAWNRSPGNALYYAVDQNRCDMVQMMLARGADIHSTGLYDETCLHCAARYGYINMARILVTAGSDIMATDDNGRYVIHACANTAYDTTDFIRWFIDDVNRGNRDIVNLRDYHDRTPLHEAVELGNLEVCQLLVEYGADVNAASKDGNRPIHGAGAKVRPSIWELLVESGAETDVENNNGLRPYLIQRPETRTDNDIHRTSEQDLDQVS